MIIELLAQTHERVDAEGLYQRAQQRDDTINLAIVYRILNTLEEMGLIREQYISPDHERKYYTLAAETYHLICRRYHKVIAFTSDVIETLRHPLETDLQVKTFNICMCVDGLCSDCQAKEHRQKRIIDE